VSLSHGGKRSDVTIGTGRRYIGLVGVIQSQLSDWNIDGVHTERGVIAVVLRWLRLMGVTTGRQTCAGGLMEELWVWGHVNPVIRVKRK
jgi:hypothetical protein